MIDALVNKLGDWLIPAAGGVLAWGALNYSVVAPRIVTLDFQNGTTSYEIAQDLPQKVRDCLTRHMAEAVLSDGRLEAAAYTASFGSFSSYYNIALKEAESSLGDQCQVDKARQAQQAAAAIEARRQAEMERQAMIKKQQQRAIENTINGIHVLKSILEETMK